MICFNSFSSGFACMSPDSGMRQTSDSTQHAFFSSGKSLCCTLVSVQILSDGDGCLYCITMINHKLTCAFPQLFDLNLFTYIWHNGVLIRHIFQFQLRCFSKTNMIFNISLMLVEFPPSAKFIQQRQTIYFLTSAIKAMQYIHSHVAFKRNA